MSNKKAVYLLSPVKLEVDKRPGNPQCLHAFTFCAWMTVRTLCVCRWPLAGLGKGIVNSDFQPVYSSFLTHSLGSAVHKENLEEEVRLLGWLLA
ncbi:hypothetical protein ACRRTK_013790 [Alexandromys fortis]